MAVIYVHDDLDLELKRFRRKVNKEGILDAYKQHTYAAGRSERKRDKRGRHARLLYQYKKRHEH